jgi:RHS repeat-associated protein
VDPDKADWYGSLIWDQQDATGYQYKRNRYYDPTTGRFTQEDPIGLAGGLNLYGFANGDAVNFSDPFGLQCTSRNRSGFWCQVGWFIHDVIVGPEGDANDDTQGLASPGMMDPVAAFTGLAASGTEVAAGSVARAATAGPVRRIFSARVLERMADDPLHNCPQSIGEEVLARGARTVKSKDYVEYTLRGTANGKAGTYEIGVRPSQSGRNEVITHWFFRPDKR